MAEREPQTPAGVKDPLAGRGILVTRPAHQAEALCRLIEDAGGRVWRLPVLAIMPVPDTAAVQAALGRLGDYDLAIFVSANAVQFALAALAPRRWPAQLPIAAVGAATARALSEQGLSVAFCPERGFNSEALLALPEFHRLAGRRLLIVRGEGGRELLRETLQTRGAEVHYLEVYRRVQTDADPSDVIAHWQAGEIHAVMINSNESLQKLQAIIGTLGAALLRKTALIVASERTREFARELGMTGELVVARDATDTAMFGALKQHFGVAIEENGSSHDQR